MGCVDRANASEGHALPAHAGVTTGQPGLRKDTRIVAANNVWIVFC